MSALCSWFPLRGASRIVPLTILVLALVGATMMGQEDVDYSKSPGVVKAIEKAQAFLRKTIDQRLAPHHELVVASLALIKSGDSPTNPGIARVIADIQQQCSGGEFKQSGHHVYEAGVCIMALGAADPVRYKYEMETISKFLIDNQNPNGSWDYPTSTAKVGDTSITQYGMLGLWEAQRAGIVVPASVWDKAAGWHIKTQDGSGGFFYHPNTLAPESVKHSMAVAGLGSLYISRMFLFPKAGAAKEDAKPEDNPQPIVVVEKKKHKGRRYQHLEPVDDGTEEEQKKVKDAQTQNSSLESIDKAINKGHDWLVTNFTVEKPTGYPIYYMYGLERYGALCNKKLFGEHDWYREGADHLVRNQDPEGYWSDQSGRYTGASFGLMFLAQVTAKTLKRIPTSTVGKGLLASGRGLPSKDGPMQVKPKIQGELDTLLDTLSTIPFDKLDQADAVQEAIVEKVALGDPKQLVGKIELLMKLVDDPRVEVRRTALWALARSQEIRVAPYLIKRLRDPAPEVVVEARNGLYVLSRTMGSQSEPPVSQAELDKEITKWEEWYRRVRPYDERDDLNLSISK